jgi:hypothetical protein
MAGWGPERAVDLDPGAIGTGGSRPRIRAGAWGSRRPFPGRVWRARRAGMEARVREEPRRHLVSSELGGRQAKLRWYCSCQHPRLSTLLVDSRNMHPRLSPHGIVTRTTARLKPHVLDSFWSPNDPGLSQRRSPQG